MKTIMISVQPQWVEKILNGEKTIEIRKTMPSRELPIKVYIYCTKDKKQKLAFHETLQRYGIYPINNTCCLNGKVVAEFTLNKVSQFDYGGLKFFDMKDQLLKNACLNDEELCNYIQDKVGYAWHIDDLKIYDTPKELSEFKTTPYCFNVKNIEFKENAFGEYVPQYHENSFCKVCKYYDGDWGDCKKSFKPLTRPPQSWCYVEEL